jgi:protein-tyrosine-phosphatase
MGGKIAELDKLPIDVVTAGTHVVENQPMSRRTRAAIIALGIDPGAHRSHQLTSLDVASADLIIAMAYEHVRYVRRHHPEGAGRTATLIYLASHLQDTDAPFSERVAELKLAELEAESEGDVPDPAGCEEPEYISCGLQIAELMRGLGKSLHA